MAHASGRVRWSVVVMGTSTAGWDRDAALRWSPDLFAWLWDVLAPKQRLAVSAGWPTIAYPEEALLQRWLADAPGGGVPERVLAYLDGEPVAALPASVPADDALQRAFVVARAIDEVLGAIAPGWTLGRLPPGLSAIHRHYWGKGRGSYNRAAPGLVVPKTPLYPQASPGGQGLGERLERLFVSLVRVRSDPALPLDFQRLPSRDDVGPDELGTQPVVGVAPLAEQVADLHFEASWRHLSPRLDVTVSAAGEGRMTAALPALVAQAIDAEVSILVLPELVMTSSITSALRRVLRTARIEHPDHGLRLVVAGTGLSEARCEHTDLPWNECVVLSGSGRELWRQKKLNHYSMDADLMTRLGVATVSERAHVENVASGEVLVVRDGFLGRMMVLICEDLAAPDPSQVALERLRPDWVFVPVLDRALHEGRWPHQQAWPNALRFGSNAIVATSLVLPLVELEADERLSRSAIPVGMCIGAARGRVKLLTVDLDTPRPRLASIAWRPEGWYRTRLILAEPKAARE